ncbi:hypothetical protein TRFO_24486 [Tritrichomonas foetus]|uniref:Uncharacterized protein n=1 Tax=Tritrichomonas foetus TaxID=1144522 RepID=A0A1J4K781_9EUKA|nr:hypothetical protein TRFO_24486 [Tritrichomonas foetus]|eukprot:OHT07329.1 hypothetical protein TRFO_24486 [Tritrichomonas foetus]
MSTIESMINNKTNQNAPIKHTHTAEDITGAEIYGKSAYDVYKDFTVSQGNGPLSEEDWLKSLKGERGPPGKDGKNGKDGVDGIPGKDGLPGMNDKSAYKIYAENVWRNPND